MLGFIGALFSTNTLRASGKPGSTDDGPETIGGWVDVKDSRPDHGEDLYEVDSGGTRFICQRVFKIEPYWVDVRLTSFGEGFARWVVSGVTRWRRIKGPMDQMK